MNTSTRVASRNSDNFHHRGLTLIEVIVVVGVILMLAALFLPAHRGARESARRMQCLNNLKNVSLAIMNQSSNGGGKLPALEDGNYGWPVLLLGYMDRNDLIGNTQYYGEVPISVYTCPDDLNNFRQPSGLSYVVNAGYGRFTSDSDSRVSRVTEIGTHTAAIDLDGNGIVDINELSINRATGVIWRDHQDGIRWTLDRISQHDGVSQSLLLTENLNARGWSSRNTMDIAFVLGRSAITFADNVTGKSALTLKDVTPGAFAINANRGNSPGESPAPSSYHPGIVNVVFCDGSARAFRETTDPTVYAHLMTPAARRYGQEPNWGRSY